MIAKETLLWTINCFNAFIFWITLQDSLVFIELQLVITLSSEECHESRNLRELRVCFPY
jgi:hypothetical protein